jgi:hypothetical protein
VAAASRSPLARLRKLCLALPEAHEVEAWGEPTFRVDNKMFAMYAAQNNHHGAGRAGVWIKAAHVTQDMLVRAQPDRYFSPPYVGPKGWVGAYLDVEPDWDVIGDLLHDAYMATVPKRLKAKLASAEPAKKRR